MKLQDKMSGVRLSINKPGFRRIMGKTHIREVADLFDADNNSVSASRKIINNRHPLVAPIVSLLADTVHYVRARTVDYPEQGVRLCRLDQVQTIADGIAVRKARLADLLQDLKAGWSSVLDEAKERLGDLFDSSDYPNDPTAHFAIYLTFPEIKPDQRLMQINPELYAEQQKIIAAKFDEALVVAEAAAATEMKKLLENLVERLKPDAEGKKKILKGSTVANIAEFIELFKTKTVGNNKELESLMEKVSAMAGGLDADELRKASAEQRQEVVGKLESALDDVAGLIETMPVRAMDLE